MGFYFQVKIYSSQTDQVIKSVNRFKEHAYGATFRSDGNLLVAGGRESVVKLFDVGTKSLLRTFKGHTG